MSTIVTRAGKGSALTHTEVDANFTNLNTDKLQSGNTAASLTITSATINGGAINSTTVGAATPSTGAFTTLSSSSTSTLNGTTIPASSTLLVSGGALGTPSSGTVTNLTGTASININGTVGATTPAAGSFTSLTDSGNLTFTGTGNRITGDFSNATVANRVAFQTSTVDGATQLNFVPNGTATTAGIFFRNSSSTVDGGQFLVRILSTEAQLSSTNYGAGTYLPMTFYTGGSERMRIDTSGNVGIGTSSPSSYANYTTLTINGTDADIDLLRGGVRQFALYTTSTLTAINNVANLPLALYTNNLERARIDTSGNLLVGQTTAGSPNSNSFGTNSSGWINVNHVNGTSSGTGYAFFGYNGGSIGSITQNGTTAVAYNTSSDYRLKHDIAPMTGALAKVAALKPVTYKWNADDSDGEGFIAHELQAVVPDAVTGEKDGEEMQGVDYGKITPLLTAALQEAIAKIETLEARLAVLEAK